MKYLPSQLMYIFRQPGGRRKLRPLLQFLAVLLGLSALVASYRRYPRLMRHLERGGSLRLPLMALLGVLGTVLTGLVGLVLVLFR